MFLCIICRWYTDMVNGLKNSDKSYEFKILKSASSYFLKGKRLCVLYG